MNVRQLRGYLVRFFGLFHRARREREFSEELESHLAMHIEDNLRAGMSPEEARRVALSKLGGVTLTKELRREQGGLPMLETLLQDLRFGLRMLCKNPGFSLIAILTLALGIGANTAIFSIVNAIVLKPLPYKEPDKLVQIWETDLKGGLGQISVSYPDFLDWQKQSDVFESMAAYVGQDFNLTGDEQAERVYGAQVSANLFALLGVSPNPGGGFSSDAETGKTEKVAVISHKLWQRRFGADTTIIGRSLLLNGEPFTVVGVIPAGFQFPTRSSEIWIPLTPAVNRGGNPRMNHALQVIARLKEEGSLPAATVAMETIARRLAGQYPESNAHIGVRVVALHEQVVGNVKPALLVLLSAVGLVLLIACANVGSLLLTRAALRENEIGVRIALGAGRARLFRQLLTECILLSLLGGGLGILLGFWGIRGLVALSPANTPRLAEVGLDFKVLAFTAALSVISGILFGLTPALETSRVELSSALKTGGKGDQGGRRQRRSIKFLVAVEVALAVVLLIGASLLIQSFLRMQGVDPGFDARNILVARLRLTESSYRTGATVKTFYRQLLERGGALPGVESIAATTNPPVVGPSRELLMTIEGRPDPGTGAWPVVISSIVTPGYFRTLNIPLRQGRDFADEDREGAPGTVVISESLAQRHWPNASPVGQRIKLGRPQDDAPWLTIVGVVGDVRHSGLIKEPKPALYLPYLGVSEQTSMVVGRYMTLMIRAKSRPEDLNNALRGAIRTLDQNQPVYGVTTLEQVLSDSLSEPRLRSWLLGLFSGAALFLAALGVYGLMAVMVGQRTQEIGLRLALGASPKNIFRLVTTAGLMPAIIGIAIGLLASLLVTRLLAGLLYQVSRLDIFTFASVPIILLAAALLACWIPARRATKVDPLVALRH